MCAIADSAPSASVNMMYAVPRFVLTEPPLLIPILWSRIGERSLQCLFMGKSTSLIIPYLPNISFKCPWLTFLVSFSTTIFVLFKACSSTDALRLLLLSSLLESDLLRVRVRRRPLWFSFSDGERDSRRGEIDRRGGVRDEGDGEASFAAGAGAGASAATECDRVLVLPLDLLRDVDGILGKRKLDCQLGERFDFKLSEDLVLMIVALWDCK